MWGISLLAVNPACPCYLHRLNEYGNYYYLICNLRDWFCTEYMNIIKYHPWKLYWYAIVSLTCFYSYNFIKFHGSRKSQAYMDLFKNVMTFSLSHSLAFYHISWKSSFCLFLLIIQIINKCRQLYYLIYGYKYWHLTEAPA